MKLKAFTLIELLIVVAIIAILAAIAVPNFLEAQIRSKVSRVKSDIRSIGVALEAYNIDNNGKYPYCYPEMLNPSNPKAGHMPLKCQWRNNDTWLTNMGSIITSPIAYISDIPWDPFMSNAWKTPPPASWGWRSIPNYCSAWYTYGVEWDWVTDICAGGIPPRLYPDAGYAMYSCGPILSLSWPPLIYDPTNGSVSRGEIIYLGKGRGFISRTGFDSSDVIYAY